ncbi:MAG TPA: YceI family protein [Ferruginibacter sp.]|nr:YceI family protein [Ferruginibacter sp.]
MKKLFFLLLSLSLGLFAEAQNIYMTKTGKATFYSRAKSPEKVEADNNEVSSVVNMQTGDMVFAILVKSFHFHSALMEEHFNENYVESNKYPKSTFKGAIKNISTVNFLKDGTYPVTVEGDLSLHGVTKNITAKGSLTIKGGKVSAYSKFDVKLKDFNISIPSLVADKISESIDIIIDCKYEPKS